MTGRAIVLAVAGAGCYAPGARHHTTTATCPAGQHANTQQEVPT